MSERPTASTIVDGVHFDGRADDWITLDETQRHRRRVVMKTQNGIEFLLDLSAARLLMHGDILKLSDGRAVEIRSKSEALLKVTADNPRHLLALAWQIGNRHLAAQILDDHILIRSDHVIENMLIGLGARVEKIEAPFNPESGAYHQHSHHHD